MSETIQDQTVYECKTLGQKLGYDNDDVSSYMLCCDVHVSRRKLLCCDVRVELSKWVGPTGPG